MGMTVSNDPFVENRKFILLCKTVFIPFKTDETTVYLDLIVPTQDEIT